MMAVVVIGVLFNLIWLGMLTWIAVIDVIRARREARRARARERVEALVYEALDDPAVRNQVCSLEGAYGEIVEDTLARLILLVGGQEQRTARELLEKRGSLENAIEVLAHGRTPQRVRAAELLGTCRYDPATPQLAEALVDSCREVRMAALSALGRVGSRAAVGAVAAALISGVRLDRHAAVLALMRLGKTAIPQLGFMVESPNREAQIVGTMLLGLTGSDKHLDDIHELLWSSDEVVALAAAEALQRIASSDSLRGLTDYVQIGQIEAVRSVALRAIGRIGDEAHVDLVSETARGAGHEIGSSAVDALRMLGGDDELNLLSLEAESNALRAMAHNSLQTDPLEVEAATNGPSYA